MVLYHHNHTKSNYPDLCSILKKADHHSASEREDIDDTQEVNKSPLISLFSKIVLEGNDKVDEQYIPLNKLSLDDGSFNNLKPTAKKDTMGGWNLVPEYNRLWNEFNSEFELIQNKTDFNTLLALLKKYASTMPSAAYKSKSDISLYDHSKTTAALAVSRYLFNRDGDVKLTQNNDLNCYLAIEGDISGIQKFIFKISSPQEAQSGMSKRLRGRSLYLTLLCDAIATFLYNLDRRDESIEYLDKISDDADSVTINAKACMFMKLEKFPKALETLNKSLKKDKTNIITLISKSECLMELKKYEEVLVCADEGLEIDKTNIPLWKNKFCALIELDQLIEAKEVQDLIFDLEIANDKAEGSLKKAINRFYSMEYRECLNLCYDVLDADKDNEEAAILMMNAVYLLGDLTEAPKALYRALNCNNGEILTRN